MNEENDFLKEEDGNFIDYFLDNVNYKIFKCYLLISIFDNLKNNYAFYTISGIFLVITIINIIFVNYTLPNLKILMINNTPTYKKLKEDTIKELKRIKNIITISPSNPNKKRTLIKQNNKKIDIVTKTTITKKTISKNVKKSKCKKKKKKKSKKNKDNKFQITDKNNQWSLVSMGTLMPPNINIEENNKEKIIIEDYNELPFTQAIIYDKRNVFQIFKSLIFSKLELINILCGSQKIKIIMIGEYILSLLTNFFFNALLYTDEVVSNKYHNNGQLDFIVTLTLSLLSNIITSIICYFIRYSEGIEDRTKFIMEIKNKKAYLRNIKVFYKYLKLKFILFIICEIVIICGCFYYIVIFCIVYSFSKVSLFINYLFSLLEGLITSIAITIIIVVIRKIGLSYSIKNIYNTSKYINAKF